MSDSTPTAPHTQQHPECLFCRIVAGEIPAEIVAESPAALAFRDINPKAPVHVLVIPKQHYSTVATLAEADAQLTGEVLQLGCEVARNEGIADTGYRTLLNTGPHAGQEVFHVHAHILGGKPLGPMLAV